MRYAMLFMVVVSGFALAGETPVERAEKEYKAAVEAAKKVLVQKLNAEKESATKKGDLDAALKIRDLIKSYDVEKVAEKPIEKPIIVDFNKVVGKWQTPTFGPWTISNERGKLLVATGDGKHTTTSRTEGNVFWGDWSDRGGSMVLEVVDDKLFISFYGGLFGQDLIEKMPTKTPNWRHEATKKN